MRRLAFLALALSLTACESARLPVAAGTGPSPALPAPNPGLVPTVVVAPAKGWPPGRTPVAANGMQVNAFASGLEHPRWLYVLPNGDVLVAETAAPPKKPAPGIKAWFMRYFMKKAGSAVPSANRITLLRDADGDGVAETKSAFLTGLNSPFGMALAGDALYVANADALMRFRYTNGTVSPTGEKIVDLPAGINHHWTKSLLASADGSRLYVGVGSNSNVAEKGMEQEVNRAAILEIDPAARTTRVYASGLRNPVGMAWHSGRRAPISSPPPSRPIMRSVRIPARWGSRFPIAARTSASTAPGTAARAAATR